MFLAGLPVPDKLILELAQLLRDNDSEETAERLENAYDNQVKLLALSIGEREDIILALDDPPDGLEELRGVLLSEHTARIRGGGP